MKVVKIDRKEEDARRPKQMLMNWLLIEGQYSVEYLIMSL